MRIKLLENLARDLVGDGKSPNLYFVSAAGNIQAISPRHDIAEAVARALGESAAVVIEDRKTGVVWENRRALREQREDD